MLDHRRLVARSIHRRLEIWGANPSCADDHDVKLIRLREERLDVNVALPTVGRLENKAKPSEGASASDRVPFLARMGAGALASGSIPPALGSSQRHRLEDETAAGIARRESILQRYRASGRSIRRESLDCFRPTRLWFDR